MALHTTPEEHDADPPSGWTVRKVADRHWQLLARCGGVLDRFSTKRDAEAARTKGWIFDLYQDEGRWFAGDTPRGWRPYAPAKGRKRATVVVMIDFPATLTPEAAHEEILRLADKWVGQGGTRILSIDDPENSRSAT